MGKSQLGCSYKVCSYKKKACKTQHYNYSDLGADGALPVDGAVGSSPSDVETVAVCGDKLHVTMNCTFSDQMVHGLILFIPCVHVQDGWVAQEAFVQIGGRGECS